MATFRDNGMMSTMNWGVIRRELRSFWLGGLAVVTAYVLGWFALTALPALSRSPSIGTLISTAMMAYSLAWLIVFARPLKRVYDAAGAWHGAVFLALAIGSAFLANVFFLFALFSLQALLMRH